MDNNEQCIENKGGIQQFCCCGILCDIYRLRIYSDSMPLYFKHLMRLQQKQHAMDSRCFFLIAISLTMRVVFTVGFEQNWGAVSAARRFRRVASLLHAQGCKNSVSTHFHIAAATSRRVCSWTGLPDVCSYVGNAGHVFTGENPSVLKSIWHSKGISPSLL